MLTFEFELIEEDKKTWYAVAGMNQDEARDKLKVRHRLSDEQMKGLKPIEY